MSFEDTILGLASVAVLGGYLFYRQWQRVTQNAEPADSKDWDGKGFDASGIAPKIDQVRKDYLAHKHAPESHFRRGLVAFARKAVAHLAYFQDRTHTAE